MIPITASDIDAINNAEAVYKKLSVEYDMSKEHLTALLFPAKKKKKENDKVSGTDLKLKRIASGMKATEVCSIIGEKNSWLSKVEKGELLITKEMYLRLSNMYGCEGGGLPENKDNYLVKENRLLKDLLMFYMSKENK